MTKTSILTRILLALGAVIVLGATYQARQESLDKEGIPGALVSVDNREFHLLCKGEAEGDSPVVILETALWGSIPEWYYVLDDISATTKVCAYDRLGMGWSSPRNKPTRSADVATELHSLLRAAKIDNPLILVGWSAGGMYVRKYHEFFPKKVAGMVLVDSSHEQQHPTVPEFEHDLSLIRFCNTVSWTGVGRLLQLFQSYAVQSFPTHWIDEQLSSYNRTSFCAGLLDERIGFDSDLAVKASPQTLKDLPLVVIGAGKPLQLDNPDNPRNQALIRQHTEGRKLLNKQLTELSSNSTLLIAENSGHGIPVEQPEIIVNAIQTLLQTSDFNTQHPLTASQ